MEVNHNIRILVVDDEENPREMLSRALERRGYDVTAVSSGEDAIQLLLEKPEMFDFALIDYVLQPVRKRGEEKRKDGIETALEISSINRDIGLVLFSGKGDEISESKQHELRRTIVHRVFQRGDVTSLESIQAYIREIMELRELRDTFEQFFKGRQAMGSILADVDAGVTLIDKDYYVWYVNDKQREIVGNSNLIGGCCYFMFHGYNDGPCEGCLVNIALEKGEEREKYFLSPVSHGKLKYMFVRVRSVYDKTGEHVIAATESVIDLTNSQILLGMEAHEHLNIILDAIYERGCNEGRGYIRSRVYRRDTTGPLFLRGYMHKGKLSALADKFDDTFYIDDISNHDFKHRTFKAKKACYWNSKLHGEDPNTIDLGIKEKWIDFPLLSDEGELLGWLAVDNREGEMPLDESDIDILQPYADEVKKVLQNKVLFGKSASQEYKRMLHFEAIKLKISAARTPAEALQIILDDIIEITDSDMGHIRAKEDSKANLVFHHGDYAKHALPSIKIDHPFSITARTIRSGRHHVVNDTSQERHEAIFSTRHPITKKIKSCVFFPLEFERENLGVVNIQSFEKNHFIDKRIVDTQELVHLASLALRDYKLIQEKEQAAKMEAELEIARRTIHNIQNPAATLKMSLKNLRKYLENEEVNKCLEKVDQSQKQLERIETLMGDIKRLLKPLHLRQQVVKVDVFLHQLFAALLASHTEVSVTYNLNLPSTKVNMDLNSIKEVFEELFSNALKAMQEKFDKAIGLTTRLASSEDLTKFEASSGEEYMCIDFSDSGSGIQDGIRDYIFEAWKSVDPSATGLGLAIVKKIIEEHGGGIWLAATSPDGSRFSIALPIHGGVDENG